MKIEGIHHVSIIVKDMDGTLEFLSKLCEMEFEEFAQAKEELGIRVSLSLDGQIELLSVVDPIKAANSPSPFKEVAEFAERVGEGLHRLHLRVKDAKEAAADAERKGIQIAYIQEGGPVGTLIPPYKKVNLGGEGILAQRVTLISDEPVKKE